MSEIGNTGADALRSPGRDFERLFESEYEALMAYSRSRYGGRLAEDIVAETLLVAWRRMDQVPESPRAWLLAVAHNVARTQIRGEKRRRALADRLSSEPGLASVESDRERNDPVLEALTRLREKDREALLLIAWDDLTPKEAAEVLHETAVAFRVRLHRARKRLRKELASPLNDVNETKAETKIRVDKFESRWI
jgi:RNA polymerase sigma-70 factor (ECF subfamily)